MAMLNNQRVIFWLKVASLSLLAWRPLVTQPGQLRYGTFLASKSGPAMKGLVGGPQS